MAIEERRLYTTTAQSMPGLKRVRIGDDPTMTLTIASPPALGGTKERSGWNPEQLYAAAVASCMHQALMLVASLRGADSSGSRVTAEVSLEHEGAMRYSFATTLSVDLPRIEPRVRSAVIAEALRSCPMAEGVRIREESPAGAR
jgi:osmotically inducible protein OsmC